MTCQITELALSGYDVDGLGAPHQLYVYARVTGACPTIELSVRVSPNGQELHRVTADVVNGVATIGFTLTEALYPCGQRMWVKAICMPGAECSAGGWIGIRCKSGAPQASGGEGEEGGGTGDWPWPSPPSIFCPMIGRRFTELFAAALLVLVGGVAFRNVVVVEAGIAGIAAAFGFAAIWQRWCVPHRCYVVGAMLWGLKRAAVGALLLGIGLVSVPTGLLAIGLFICAGLCTAYLRQHRCFLPKLSTPLAALPMW